MEHAMQRGRKQSCTSGGSSSDGTGLPKGASRARFTKQMQSALSTDGDWRSVMEPPRLCMQCQEVGTSHAQV
eukprot:697835-Lingulodinium_polyedra.AAC.1